MSRLDFRLEAVASGSRARAGRFRTLHNEVLTPLFMPVGTLATVRAQRFETLEAAGSQILLANTYHLLQRPGPEVFQKLGGIHGLTQWKKSFLTDSGGFQIFSLAPARKMSEEGASFRSYHNGQRILLTPERSIEMQKAIGSDIMMVLDQCIPSTADHATAVQALELTERWARRSLAARGDSPQSLFGIVQGAVFQDLRKQSAEQITALPFDGFAIGGLAVGESRREREDTTEFTTQFLPSDRPRYLMGVGTPIDLLEAVHRGVDMFDCILPTAWAQQGVAFTSKGRIDFRRGVYKFQEEKLDPACSCPACSTYSRAYLHHLVKAKEVLGWQLLGEHNLHFYHQLMREIRASILDDTFTELYRRKKPVLERTDEDNPVEPPKRFRRPKEPVLVIGNYTIHQSTSGFYSIKHVASGEIMHSVIDPEVEARRLYIEQAKLKERLLAPRLLEGEAISAALGGVESAPAATPLEAASAEDASALPPLVIWDVGLGAATNAMAAVRAYEEWCAECAEQGSAQALRPLRIVSFENDLDSLRLVLEHPFKFKQAKHPGPHVLLKAREWRSKQADLEWTLLEGDFLDKMAQAPLPDLVFYDPFSFKTDSPLWAWDAFRKLRERLGDQACAIFTYSASTAARAAILAAGFFVAKGWATGPKTETTVALTPRARQTDLGGYELLGAEWLGKWERSGARIPPSVSVNDQLLFEEAIRRHPQFC